MALDDKVEEAKYAISVVFSDTSVSPEDTLANLKDLRDDLDVRIDALIVDIG